MFVGPFKLHPVSLLFPSSPRRVQALRRHLAAGRQPTPMTWQWQGNQAMLLTGCHLYLALRQRLEGWVNLSPHTPSPWLKEVPRDESALSHIIEYHAWKHREDLTPTQRLVLAAHFLPAYGRGGQRREAAYANWSRREQAQGSLRARDLATYDWGVVVSGRSLARLHRRLEPACSTLMEQLISGRVGIDDAVQIACLSPSEQRAALEHILPRTPEPSWRPNLRDVMARVAEPTPTPVPLQLLTTAARKRPLVRGLLQSLAASLREGVDDVELIRRTLTFFQSHQSSPVSRPKTDMRSDQARSLRH